MLSKVGITTFLDPLTTVGGLPSSQSDRAVDLFEPLPSRGNCSPGAFIWHLSGDLAEIQSPSLS